jgi:hypothetical protein
MRGATQGNFGGFIDIAANPAAAKTSRPAIARRLGDTFEPLIVLFILVPFDLVECWGAIALPHFLTEQKAEVPK